MRTTLLAVFLTIMAASGQPFPDSGEFLIGADVDTSGYPRDQAAPDVTFDGANYLVAWAHYEDRLIMAGRVSPSGVPLDTAGILVASSSGPPRVSASDSGLSLVAWFDGGRLKAARVTLDGTVLDPNGFAVGSGEFPSGPWVASDGTCWLVFWDAYDLSGRTYVLYVARVWPDGRVTGTREFARDIAYGQSSLCWGPGSCYLVVWRASSTRLDCALLDEDGHVLHRIEVNDSYVSSPAIAAGSSRFLVSWIGQEDTLRAAFVDTSGTVSEPFTVLDAQSSSSRFRPAAGFNGTYYLVAACGDGNLDTVVGTRVSRSGEVLDPQGIVYGTHGWGCRPSLASDGSHFLLATYSRPDSVSGRDIQCALIDTTGTASQQFYIQPFFHRVPREQTGASAAFNGNNYLVTWFQRDPVERKYSIRCIRVSPEGALVDSRSLVIVTPRWGLSMPSIATLGGQSLCVWGWGEVQGARLDTNGQVLEPNPIQISPASETQLWPRTAASDSLYLVVWSRGNDTVRAIAARISSDGNVLDPGGFRVTSVPLQTRPSCGSNGSSFLVVWTQHAGAQYDIWGARVTSVGTVLDTTPMVISELEGDEYYCSVAHGRDSYAVVWLRELPSGGREVRFRRVSDEGMVIDSVPLAITDSSIALCQPAVVADDSAYHIMCVVDRSGRRSALLLTLDRSCSVVDSCEWSNDLYRFPALASGPDGRILAAYSRHTDSYDTRRIWGRLFSGVGISERGPTAFSTPGTPAALVRSTLHIRPNHKSHLLDITGRRVMDLQPGPNDIRHLSPGVYFVRREEDNITTRVVVQK